MSAFIEMLIEITPVVIGTFTVIVSGAAFKLTRRKHHACTTSRPKEATRVKSDVLREIALRAHEESLPEDIQIILLKARLGIGETERKMGGSGT